jgi:prolyl-tRNA synthetase
MKDTILKEGAEVVSTFEKKIIKLENEEIKGYHLLTTPEPMIVDLATSGLSSYRQLPIRIAYNIEFVRGINRPKGILKGRQFTVFTANSLDADTTSVNKSIKLFERLSDNIFGRLHIPIHKRHNKGGVDIEHFYLCDEGENLAIPEIDDTERTQALSLSMAYHYCSDKKLKAKYKSTNNKKEHIKYITFGLGTQRALYSVFNAHRDKLGFNLPSNIASHKASIIPYSQQDINFANNIYEQNPDMILDNRTEMSIGQRAQFSEYIGIPWKIMCKEDNIVIKNRDSTISTDCIGTENLEEFIKINIK